MVCREIETPACTTLSIFTHMSRSQIPILISGHRHRVHWTPGYIYIYIYIYRFIALPRDELPQYINIHMLISHMPKAN